MLDDDTCCIKSIIRGDSWPDFSGALVGIQKRGSFRYGKKKGSLLKACDKSSKAAENPLLGAFNTNPDIVKHSCEHKSSQERYLESTQELLLRLSLYNSLTINCCFQLNDHSNDPIYEKLHGEYAVQFKNTGGSSGLGRLTGSEQLFYLSLGEGNALLAQFKQIRPRGRSPSGEVLSCKRQHRK